MTIWIAQNKRDRTWIMAFESRPTDEDLRQASLVSLWAVGLRSDWDVYGHHVHATEVGMKRRKRQKQTGHCQ